MIFELSENLRAAIAEYAATQNISVDDDTLKVTRASLNGDSFAADVLRVAIVVPRRDENGNVAPDEASSDPTSAPRELRLIVKVAPKMKFRREMYNIPVLFEREKFMYTTILPEFRAFEMKHLLPGHKAFDNYPQLIRSCNQEGNEFIMLNDICDLGYSTADRTQGANYAVCKEILKKFAKLHAISFVFQAKDKHRFHEILGDNLRETLFVEDIPDSFKGFLQSKIDLIREKLRQYPNGDTDALVLERMEVFRRDCAQVMHAACNVRDYAVICHGDSWISNFMFKWKDQDVMDIKIIDFQVSRYTTPVVDLSYFLGCSTDRKLREHLPELLLDYYKTLMEEIRCLGHDSPETLYPYEAFTRHCATHMKFGFGMAMMSLHSITCPQSDMPDVLHLLETCNFEKMDEITRMLSDNPAYCKRVTELVRDMVNFNYL